MNCSLPVKLLGYMESWESEDQKCQKWKAIESQLPHLNGTSEVKLGSEAMSLGHAA